MTSIHTIHFKEADPQKQGGFERLLNAMKVSHQRHSPSVPLVCHMESPDGSLQSFNRLATRECRQSFVDNTNKMRAWNQVAQDANTGDTILLIDCDTLILRGLSDIDDVLGDHELAFTMKPKGAQFPFNSGVVIARINDGTRKFFREWLDTNEAFLANGAKHQSYRLRYGGINQASLGYMLRNHYANESSESLSILHLQCQEWNCENETWKNFNDTTRILHIKSGLRKGCLTGDIPPVGKHKIEPLVEIWRQYDTATENH